MNQAFICDAVRTPFGRFGGALATMRADDLAALPLKALLARNPGLDPSRIDDVIFCCWPACRRACPGAPSTACAVPALTRSASRRGRLKAGRRS